MKTIHHKAQLRDTKQFTNKELKTNQNKGALNIANCLKLKDNYTNLLRENNVKKQESYGKVAKFIQQKI